MKKLLLSLAALLMASASVNAQNFMMQQAPAPMVKANAEETLTWLQNYNENFTQMSRFGAGAEADFGGWVGYTTTKLADYDGKQFSVVKIYVSEDMKDATVWVRKGGSSVSDATVVAETKATLIGGTWSYIKFDEPITIDASTKYYIGYQAQVSATAYPVVGDATKLTTSHKGMSGAYYNDGSGAQYIDFVDNQSFRAIGHLLVAALVDGNADNIPTVAITAANFGDQIYAEVGSKLTPKVTIANAGYQNVESYEISYTVDGNEQAIQSESALAPNSIVELSMPEATIGASTTLAVKLAKINGVAVADAPVFEQTLRGYEAADLVDRNALLIEKFTGQGCGYCPGGETSVNNAIKGHEDQVARINHHFGYMDDIFTIYESQITGYSLGVNGAPSVLFNRAYYPDFAAAMQSIGYLPFHPSLLTSRFIEDELAKKSLTSINVEDSYNVDTREYTVTVSGTGAIDMKGMYVTAVLTQSGYKAYQNQGGANYSHDDFPILYMTDEAMGQEITSDGKEWTVTFTKAVPEKIGQNVKVDLSKLEIVAFVNGTWEKTIAEPMVLNAATKEAATGAASVEGIEMNNALNVYADGNRIAVDGEYDTMEIYNAAGLSFNNESLAPGLYIVKVVAGGNVQTAKVVVR